MHALFKKLSYKNGAGICLINQPDSEILSAAVREMLLLPGVESIKTNLAGKKFECDTERKAFPVPRFEFILFFAMLQKEVDAFAARLEELNLKNAVNGETVIWIAYPKGSSRKFKCEFNRDNGWAKMGETGYEPVSQVAIDEDWTALRFKKVEHIKTMKRKSAISKAGKKRLLETKKKSRNV